MHCNYLPIRCRKIRSQSGILRYGRLLHSFFDLQNSFSIANNFFNLYRTNNKNTPESVSSSLSFTLPRLKILSVFFQFHPQELHSNHSNTACFNDILPLMSTTRAQLIQNVLGQTSWTQLRNIARTAMFFFPFLSRNGSQLFVRCPF